MDLGCVVVAGGGRTGSRRLRREQFDPEEAPRLDVRPQGAAQNAGRPRRLLPGTQGGRVGFGSSRLRENRRPADESTGSAHPQLSVQPHLELPLQVDI